MKRLRNLIVVISLALVMAIAVALFAGAVSPTEKPKPDYRLLRAEGSDFVDELGNKVYLKGINAGGLFVQEEWMCPVSSKDTLTTYNTLISRFGYDDAMTLVKAYQDAWWTERDFDNVKELGFNMIRLPFAYFNIEDESGNLTNFSKLDWFIDNCDERDIYVILDLHGAYGSQNGKDHSGDTSGTDLFGNATNEAKTIALWEAVAARYKDRDIIAGYDLLNEPEGAHGYTDYRQWNFYDKLYDAIRKIDVNHVLIMEAVWETNSLPAPNMYKWQNVCYSYHNYGWDDINNFDYQKDFTDKKIADYVNQRDYYEVPLFVGEFTLFSNVESWNYALSAYQNNNVNYAIWTYKVYTGGGASSWGIYCGGGERVDVETDSYEDILNKWSAESTLNSYKYNTLYDNILNKGE
ncbi:MAG: cellulase family glycosylhydrolase [Clostridia bacterium]|nr:cellulase family glycosylhydrolase [Clostridia bacterium]